MHFRRVAADLRPSSLRGFKMKFIPGLSITRLLAILFLSTLFVQVAIAKPVITGAEVLFNDSGKPEKIRIEGLDFGPSPTVGIGNYNSNLTIVESTCMTKPVTAPLQCLVANLPAGIIDGDFKLIVNNPSTAVSCADGRPVALRFAYTGDSCAASNHSQGGKAKCSDLDSLAEPAEVVFTKDVTKIMVVPEGEFLFLNDKVTILSVRNKMNPTLEFEVQQGGLALQSLKLQTSCSRPLSVGDQFGSMLLTEFFLEGTDPQQYVGSYDLTIGAVGPMGPQGEQGIQGQEGPQGEQGFTGVAGADGEQGPQGEQGLAGAPGDDGADGERGIQGEQGIQGAEGPQGEKGLAGTPGDDGADGAPGDDGTDGAPGADGLEGSAGPIGDKGDQGPPGPDGPIVVTTRECPGDSYPDFCANRTVVTIPVTHGITTVMETKLEDSVHIEVSKTVPELVYPLKFFHTVAYFPSEEVIPVKNTAVGISSCIDSATALDPHCGWTNSVGVKIQRSQGFCCNKDLELITNTSGPWRGEQFLGRVSSGLDSFSTAHCLRMGELYYEGYEILEPRVTYDIKVVTTQGAKVDELHVSPENPVSYQEDTFVSPMKMRAELQGEFSEYAGAPDLSNYILYIPSSPDSHEYVQNYHNNMLLVPREEVSRDGHELDKVGVSFYAFRKMAGECSVSMAGDGLHNQLYHMHNADLQLLGSNPNLESMYLLHGKHWVRGSMDFKPGMEKQLTYLIRNINYSRLSLSMETDELPAMVTPHIEGLIKEARVDKFVAMSADGILRVTVMNTGDVRGDYVVTVTDPSYEILEAIPAQARTVAHEAEEILYFDLHTLRNLESSFDVLVTLKTPDDFLLDEVTVTFESEKHLSWYSWELLRRNEGTQQGSNN